MLTPGIYFHFVIADVCHSKLLRPAERRICVCVCVNVCGQSMWCIGGCLPFPWLTSTVQVQFNELG